VWQVTHLRERCQWSEARSIKSTALATDICLAKGSSGEFGAGASGLVKGSSAVEEAAMASRAVSRTGGYRFI